MKRISNAKTAFILFGIMTVASLSGAVSSSLAWYAYSTRALVSYSGTSINETTFLEIGICSDEQITDMPSNIRQISYAGDSNYYYFSEFGKGLTYEPIAKYLEKKGFATNKIEPTTSGSYVAGYDQDNFSLKQAPNELVRGNTAIAEKKTYLTIPLVFRVQGENSSVYLDGVELWLTKAVAKASSTADGDVYKAIRLFVDRDARNYGDWQVSSDIETGTEIPSGNLGHTYYLKTDDRKLYSYKDNAWTLLVDGIRIETSAQDIDAFAVGEMYFNSSDNKLYAKPANDFIVNPSANNAGKTRVAGLLNRTRDDYYDYDVGGEILYGEYNPEAVTDLLSTEGYSGADVIEDVNGTNSNEPSTFVAKHFPNVKYYSDFSDPSNDVYFKHAEYESISSVSPVENNRYLTNVNPLNPTSVCKTRADDNHLARVNLTVYLEGWDFSVIDKEIEHSFDLGLTFEMSRI